MKSRQLVDLPTKRIRYKNGSNGTKYVYYTVRSYRNAQGKPTSDEKSIGKLDEATGQLIPMVEPLLRAAKGQAKAVFFDDTRTGEKFFGSYGATKAGQIALARAWASENQSIGPQVRILQPAPMATALRARFFPGEERETLAHPKTEAEAILAQI